MLRLLRGILRLSHRSAGSPGGSPGGSPISRSHMVPGPGCAGGSLVSRGSDISPSPGGVARRETAERLTNGEPGTEAGTEPGVEEPRRDARDGGRGGRGSRGGQGGEGEEPPTHPSNTLGAPSVGHGEPRLWGEASEVEASEQALSIITHARRVPPRIW